MDRLFRRKGGRRESGRGARGGEEISRGAAKGQRQSRRIRLKRADTGVNHGFCWSMSVP